MAKHSSPTTENWRQIIVWAIVGLVVVVGAASVYLLLRDDDPGAQTASREPAAATTGTTPPDCSPATVWAAPGLAPAVQEAADRTSDDCFNYLVVTRTAALAQSGLRGGETPDVWLPDSDAWPVLVEQGGVELAVGETVASSPVLLAGTPQMVQALGDLGIGPDTSFAELVRTYQRLAATGGERPVTMRVGDPRTDPATMALLSTVGSQLDAGEAGSPGRQSLVVLAQTAAPGDPLTAIAADPRTVVPATEQQIAAGAQAGTGLVGIGLEGGAGVVRMPFVRVGDAGSADAVDALERALTSPDAEADLADLGLRPGTDGPAPGVAGVPDDVTTKGEATSPEQVLATAQIWTVIAPQSRILTLIDISGSMAAEVGDTTRIGLTRQAAQAALAEQQIRLRDATQSTRGGDRGDGAVLGARAAVGRRQAELERARKEYADWGRELVDLAMRVNDEVIASTTGTAASAGERTWSRVGKVNVCSRTSRVV